MHPKLKNHRWLADMYDDGYFPDHLVDKVRDVMVAMAEQIEAAQPKTEAEVYAITHPATEAINDLEDDFFEAGSEIETVARDSIAVNFRAVLSAYGVPFDLEDAIAPREW